MKRGLLEPIGSNQNVFDLIFPFLEDKDCMRLSRVHRGFKRACTVGVKRKYGNLKTLDLSDKGLQRIGVELAQLTSLQHLYLDSNPGLTSIPKELGQLSSLRTLCLHSNPGLTSIPKELGQLSSLQVLYLFNNPGLTSIPKELRQLSSIQFLYLHNNPGLISIPKELGQLLSLQMCAFDHESLHFFPVEWNRFVK